MNTETLAALGITKEDILNRAAEKLLEQCEADRYDGEEVQDRALKAMREERDEIIRVRIEQAVETLMNEHIEKQLGVPVQRTDQYGNPKGEPQTLAEYVVAHGVTYLDAKVNERGEEVNKNDYGYREARTRFAYLVAKSSEGKVAAAVTKLVQDEQKRWADLATSLVAEALKNASVAIRVR